MYSNFIIFTFIVESCIKFSKNTNIFYASSGEIYGSNLSNVDENTKKKPANPYALSKYIAMEYISYMKKYFDLNISIGIFFNHDSIYRSNDNISKKIINFLNKKNSNNSKLELGNIDIFRDWGYAKEYVEAIHKINRSPNSNDFIIASGKSLLLRDVIKYAFKLKNKNYLKFININKNKFNKKEIRKMSVNINKIKRKLNWKPKKNIKNLIKEELI